MRSVLIAITLGLMGFVAGAEMVAGDAREADRAAKTMKEIRERSRGVGPAQMDGFRKRMRNLAEKRMLAREMASMVSASCVPLSYAGASVIEEALIAYKSQHASQQDEAGACLPRDLEGALRAPVAEAIALAD